LPALGSSLVAIGVVLALTIGLPTLPGALPSFSDENQLDLLARSPTPAQLAAVVSVLEWAVWLLWAWLAGSLCLRVLVGLLERARRDAPWWRLLRRLSDVLTLPVVRRSVDAALAAALVVRVAATTPVLADSASDIASQVTEDAPSDESAPSDDEATPLPPDIQLGPGDVLYTVQPGDTLNSVAENFFGDPDEYPQIVVDNQDLPQPDGRTLAEARQIFTDYRLVIRNPRQVRAEHDAVYIVKKGDTLSGVALREFGDAGLWPKLFERNEGAELGDGHVLTNPNLIWPGLELRKDLAYVDAAAASSDIDPNAAAPEPAPSPEPATAPATSVTPEPQPASPTSIAVVASTKPVPATPPPVPVAVSQPAPTEVPTAVPLLGGPPASEPERPGMPVEAGLIAAAGASAVLLSFAAARSFRRRWPTSVFQSDVVMDGGFAQAMGDELAYEQRTSALAEHVLTLAAATGYPHVRLLAARAGRTDVSLLLLDTSADLTLPIIIAKSNAVRASDVHVEEDDGGGWWWEQRWKSAVPHAVDSQSNDAHVRLVPIGVAGGRRVVWLEQDGAGPMLIAGSAEAGVYELLTWLVLDHARRLDPDDLSLVTIASPTRLDPLLADLPHQGLGFVDPGDEQMVERVLDELLAELERRLASAGPRAEVLVVVDEWAALPTRAHQVVDAIGQRGAEVGMRVIAATTRVEEDGLSRSIELFPTCLVFSVPTRAASERLLGARGDDGAHMLDMVGEVLPCVQGHVLPRIRAFRVPGLHVAYLVDQMRTRYQSGVCAVPEHLTSAVDVGAEGAAAAAEVTAVADVDAQLRAASVRLGQPVEWEDSDAPTSSKRQRQDEEAITRASSSDEAASEPDGSADALSARADTPLVQDVNGAQGDRETAVVHTMMPRSVPDADVVQRVLIPAIVVGGTDRTRASSAIAGDLGHRRTRVELRVLGQQALRIDGSRDVPPPRSFSRAWEIGLAMACLPVDPTLAALGKFIWPDTPEKAAKGRIYRALSDLRQVLREGLGADADRVVLTVAGVCRWNEELVTIDAREFLGAVQLGQRADRLAATASDGGVRARHVSAARLAFQQARDLWQGELLPGLETRYAWLEEAVEGSLSLRGLYDQQHRHATLVLAELLVGEGQHGQAVELYEELLANPGPPDSRYGSEQERCEAIAQALYRCYASLGDQPGLERARDQLMVALRRLDVDGRLKERTLPDPATVALYERLRRETDHLVREG
jgi:DNA-binding SARP family transcriptional activator